MENSKSVGRFIRFPQPINKWLKDYASNNGFSSEADLVRHIVREFKQSKETGHKQAYSKTSNAGR